MLLSIVVQEGCTPEMYTNIALARSQSCKLLIVVLWNMRPAAWHAAGLI